MLLQVRNAGSETQIDDVEQNAEASEDDEDNSEDSRLSLVERFRRRRLLLVRLHSRVSDSVRKLQTRFSCSDQETTHRQQRYRHDHKHRYAPYGYRLNKQMNEWMNEWINE